MRRGMTLESGTCPAARGLPHRGSRERALQRGWSAWMVLAGVALGLRWLAAEAGDARIGSARGDERQGPELAGREELLASTSPPLTPVDACGRELQEDYLSRAAELARAHWVEGRVDLPAGVPADEVCFVVADGRPFSDGTLHRARVGPDGRFRVAFSPKAKAGWIGLEGRYLYLRERARWRLAKPPENGVTLAPQLGGVVTGRVLLPARANGSRSPCGDVSLCGVPPYSINRSVPIGRGGEFVFERVPVGNALVLEQRGTVWLGKSQPFPLRSGENKRVDLELVAGVALSGAVRDEHG